MRKKPGSRQVLYLAFFVASASVLGCRYAPAQWKASAQMRLERHLANNGLSANEAFVNNSGMMEIDFRKKPVADISALRCMPIEILRLEGSGVRDLSPLLETRTLRRLGISNTQVVDLGPLSRLLLEHLDASNLRIDDVTALAKVPLKHLNIAYTDVSDITPLQNLPLVFLNISGLALKDLSPLKSIALETIYFTPESLEKNGEAIQILRGIKSLKCINMRTDPAEFWREYDSGKLSADAADGDTHP